MVEQKVTAQLFAQWLVEADNSVGFTRFSPEAWEAPVEARYLAYAEHCVANVDPSDWPGCILERMEGEKVQRGDEVYIVSSCMAPWGWPLYPKIPGMDSVTHIDIPAGTRAVVVLASEGEGAVTVDYVLDATLYRTLVERQYVRKSGD
jgi:hypothetical protein